MTEEQAEYKTEVDDAMEMLGAGYEEKAKHTPAPWKVETFTRPSYNGDMEFSIISGSKGWANSGMQNQRTIAEVGHWKDRPNSEADARLIAAAPELLEALKKWVAWECDLLNTHEAWEDGLPKMTQELFDKYLEMQLVRNEAIKKATP